MAKITLSKLRHSYYRNPKLADDYALQEIDLDWEDGGAYALLGPSGCGKSTLLNIISGLLVPTEGKILFDGKEVTSLTPNQRNIAQVFQFPVVYDTMTVRENLAFPLKNRGLTRAAVQARVGLIAGMIGLEDILDRKARGLTTDAKQKISLGRGMVRESVNAILFDEPLTVIDPHLKWELRTQLKSLHRELGHTMIYVTHDQVEAMTMADKIVVLQNGEIEQVGSPLDLYRSPINTFVASFIGSPKMNMVPCFSEDGNIILQIGSGEKTSIKSPAKETSKMEVRAETISYEDFINNNGWINSKTNGKMRLEGKDYIVKDGDVLNFRFNT